MELTVALVSDAVEFAGAERYAVVLADELRDRARVRAFLPAAAPSETAERFTAAGAETFAIPGLARIPAPRAVAALARALRAARPDVLHLNFTDQGDALALVAAAALVRIPTVAVLHNVIPARVPWREAISRAALRVPAHVVSVSDAVADYVRAAGIRTTVVENGLPALAPPEHPRALLGLPDDALVIGGLGRLHAQKGWDVLASAVRLVRAELPDVRVVVVGEGEERPALEALGGLELVGYRPDAAGLAAAFDIAVVPSRYEAFGLVALEAMQLGVPVVASSAGGLPRVLGDAGVLVPPEDPVALATALLSLARDPDRRRELGRRGRARATSEFGSARMAAETLAVYERVTFNPRPPGVRDPRETR